MWSITETRYVWWWVCGHAPQLTVRALSLATLGRTNGEPRIALESFIIEINPSACGKWEDNIIIAPRASCFYFSICFLSFCQAVAIWCIVYVYALVWVCWRVCVHVRGSKYSLENPIKGDMYWFAVLFKAFWDISTDISFNVRASCRKQTNLLLLLPSFLLSSPSFTCFLSSVTLHQSLSYTPPTLYFFPLFIAMLLQDATLSFVLLSVLLLSFGTMKVWIDKLLGVFFWSWTRVSDVLNVMLSISELCENKEKKKAVSGSTFLHYLMYSTTAMSHIPNNTTKQMKRMNLSWSPTELHNGLIPILLNAS